MTPAVPMAVKRTMVERKEGEAEGRAEQRIRPMTMEQGRMLSQAWGSWSWRWGHAVYARVGVGAVADAKRKRDEGVEWRE